jgi:glycogen debranching enzyme
MLVTQTAQGPYPYAGVPWFSTTFGRDGIITAWQCLLLFPELARGVLRFLADTQSTTCDEARDAEPGKILHEARGGEMAQMGEVPFGRYYGSVDATPLFVALAGAYYDRTGDLELIGQLWPHVEAALRWCTDFGDADGDGFTEYRRRTDRGLTNHGWKDSWDAVFHADGRLAEAPIALCEVQGYVYAAFAAAAKLSHALGYGEREREYEGRANALAERFDRVFWSERLGSYVYALDGEKKPCQVRVSNVGHCLFSRIARSCRAAQLARLLLSERFFSGWGVRTLAAEEPHYNPMSYHNGSVWPHDNALIAAGLAHYGFKEEAAQITAGLFDASLFVELNRLPELFCGFIRRPGKAPVTYPVACAPQAWSTGAPFMLLASLLGLEIDGVAKQIKFVNPMLPRFLEMVELRNLRVGDVSVDLRLERQPEDVSLRMLRRAPGIEVVVYR